MLGRPESMIMGREVILSGSVQQFIDLLMWIMIQHFHRHNAASPTYSIFCTKRKEKGEKKKNGLFTDSLLENNVLFFFFNFLRK